MKQHCDHIHSLFEGERKGIPVLSIVGLLNDDFEGGEFIMWGDEVIPMSAGSVLVFPSNFMYPHRVNPVTKGTRYSFVSWSW
jgi:predicted 2-oxoglutarate/Fe(II)-dependent dioxygenase YbiX